MTQGPRAARPRIPVERYGERLAAARREASDAGLDALLVGVGADLRYLTGYEAMPLERLTLLVVPAADGGPMTLIAPRLEATPARTCPAGASGAVTVVTWEETEDPMVLVAAVLEEALGRAAAGLGAVAVSDGLRAAFVLGLQRVLPVARFSLASAVLRTLRMRKDADEVELLRAAAQAADRVVAAIAAGTLVGRTEADVAREVGERLLAEGHDHAEFWIVASGPNSASPHHEPGERVIAAGEPIVIDIGGMLGGYGSDITRTVWVTGGDPAMGPDAEFLRLYGVLRRGPGGGDGRGPSRGAPASGSMRWRARSSTPRATGRPSSTGRATASASKGTRSRTWWPAAWNRWRRAWRSAWSPGSTSRAATGPGSRTSWSVATPAP